MFAFQDCRTVSLASYVQIFGYVLGGFQVKDTRTSQAPLITDFAAPPFTSQNNFEYSIDRDIHCRGFHLSIPKVSALQSIGRMRGGSQSHLLLCDDSRLCVVKFRNNPQHQAILANELIVTRICEALGISVPKCFVVDVSAQLIDDSPAMVAIHSDGRLEPFQPGLHFGSQFAGGLMPGQVLDYLPQTHLHQVTNIAEFAGMLAVDKWTANSDDRQVVFTRNARQRHYRAIFIDHGYSFNGGRWTLHDTPLQGLYSCTRVYHNVTSWDSFEPWLSRLEGFDPQALWRIMAAVPHEWHGGDFSTLEQLTDALIDRRSMVRSLIERSRMSHGTLFPRWGSLRANRVLANPIRESPTSPLRTQYPSLTKSQSQNSAASPWYSPRGATVRATFDSQTAVGFGSNNRIRSHTGDGLPGELSDAGDANSF
jgi:hypothetical protein